MINPIELLLQPISLAIFALYGGLWLYESWNPGRSLEPLPGSTMRGLLAFAGLFFASSYLPALWDTHLASFQLFDLGHLHPLVGALVALLSYELVAYAYHRTLHSSDLLFRYVHQMHHSSERLNVPSAFYFHPLDMIGWTLVTSLGFVLIVGVSPLATTIALIAVNFLGIFQHANIRTPRWLGYLIQRPESHSVHHARGYHRSNYADLPLFDLLFGTFENPRDFAQATGFSRGASARVGAMLRGENVAECEIQAAQSRVGAVVSR